MKTQPLTKRTTSTSWHDLLNERVYDSLEDEVALLDHEGRVIGTNDAWTDSACNGDNRLHATGPGWNYLAGWKRRAASGDPTAKPIIEGVNGILQGRRLDYVTTFECTSGDERRSYILSASAMGGDLHGALISHREQIVLPGQRVQIPGNPSSRSYSSVAASALPAITKYLANSLRARHTIICELARHGPRRLRIVAHWANGEFTESTESFPEEFAWQDINGTAICRASLLHPHEGEDMEWLGVIESPEALSVPVYDSFARQIGLIAIIDSAPLDAGLETELMLRRTAIAAGPELERRRLVWQAAFDARLVEGADDAIIGTDADFRITRWNPAAMKIYGWSRDEVLGRTLSEVLQTELTSTERAKAIESVQERDAVRNEYIQHRKDGSKIDIEATTMSIRGRTGAINGFVSINRDITARKIAETRLNHALTAKDQFLSLVSHELRTPLTMIMGNAWSMAHRAESQTPERMIENSSIIYEEAIKLTSIVDNLLMLSRAERGDQLQIEPVDLCRLTKRILAAPRVPGHHEMEVDIPREGILVLANETAVEQVLINLLSNAAKYSQEGTTLSVSLLTDGEESVLSVRDQGPGLREDALAAVFEPFYRGEKSTSIPGMGVGLTVCRRLVEAMNGRIWAENHPGGGAMFSFALPLATGGIEDSQTEPSAADASDEEDVAEEEVA